MRQILLNIAYAIQLHNNNVEISKLTLANRLRHERQKVLISILIQTLRELP